MPRSNSERFIYAYNRIEKEMQKLSGLNNGFMPFSRLIDKTKGNNAIIRRYEMDLREFGDLRNAIVHSRTGKDFVIAEPHASIVEMIEQIDKELSEPLTVGQMYRRRVHTMQAHDTLEAALRLMKEKHFNQIPIYDRREFVGLVTPTGITYWLTDQATGQNISWEMPTLYDIYLHEKHRKSYAFIKASQTVYEAEEYFKKAFSRGRRMEALLITEHGRPHEKLLGIITPLDLVRI